MSNGLVMNLRPTTENRKSRSITSRFRTNPLRGALRSLAIITTPANLADSALRGIARLSGVAGAVCVWWAFAPPFGVPCPRLPTDVVDRLCDRHHIEEGGLGAHG